VTTRKLMTAVGAGALALGVLMVSMPGPAVAATSSATVSCAGLSGSITFRPALTTGGSASELAVGKLNLRGCMASGASPKAGVASITLTGLKDNHCAGLLGSGLGATVAVKWSPKTIASSEVTFAGLSPPAGSSHTWKAGGAGTAVNGSYGGADNGAKSTAHLTSTQTADHIANACASHAGLKALKISGGSLNLK
jgi:hypothetical protein